MTKELLWLTLTIILTGVLWVPYIIDRIQVRGLMGAMANPSRRDRPQSPWAERLYFAHTNAVDNLVIFAPLVLMLDALGHSTPRHGVGLRGLFLRAARARDRLRARHSGGAHAGVRGRICRAGRAGAGGIRQSLTTHGEPPS